MAVSRGHHNIVQLLLSEGADPNKPDRVSVINNELFTSNKYLISGPCEIVTLLNNVFTILIVVIND